MKTYNFETKKKHKKEAAEVSFKAARLKLMPILQRNVL